MEEMVYREERHLKGGSGRDERAVKGGSGEKVELRMYVPGKWMEERDVKEGSGGERGASREVEGRKCVGRVWLLLSQNQSGVGPLTARQLVFAACVIG